jgi:hypothetical protein
MLKVMKSFFQNSYSYKGRPDKIGCGETRLLGDKGYAQTGLVGS